MKNTVAHQFDTEVATRLNDAHVGSYHQNQRPLSSHCKEVQMGRAAQIVRERLNFEENCGMVKQLAVGGVWVVPVEQRPNGWQGLNLKEPA